MDINKVGKRLTARAARAVNSLSTNQLGKRSVARTARAIDSLSEITGYIGGLAILVAAVVIVHAVVTREMGISAYWQEELSRFLLIMAAFVGAAYTQKRGGHISCDIVTVALPTKSREVVHLIGSVVTVVVVGVIAWYAWPWWWEATSHGWRT